jgi:DNA invertase Pin-like site-specific DNA recombinase
MIIGYARVSTDGQSLDSQQASLKAAGAERIFAEKISGAITDRKALAYAIKALGTGDILLVTRLDRLARSTRDLLNILDQVSKAGAKFKSLADAWADTSTMHGELMITILAGLATFERHLIRARTDEGRKRAQARGVRFGRKPKLTKHQIAEALLRLFRAEARRVGDHHLGQADDGVERRAQLMAHAGKELRLVLARQLKLAGMS